MKPPYRPSTVPSVSGCRMSVLVFRVHARESVHSAALSWLRESWLEPLLCLILRTIISNLIGYAVEMAALRPKVATERGSQRSSLGGQ